MKKQVAVIVAFVALSSAAYASSGAEPGKSGMLLWIFLAFLGAVLVLQLIPGIALFISMLKGLLFPAEEKENETKKSQG